MSDTRGHHAEVGGGAKSLGPLAVVPAQPTRGGGLGHRHQHPLLIPTRRQFLQGTAAGTAALVLGGRILCGATPAFGDPVGPAEPRPIPGGIEFVGQQFHVFLTSDPGPGTEPATITDFVGTVGLAEIGGHGVDGDGNELVFDVDLRFMDGVFLGDDGLPHRGTFGFV